MPTLGHKAESYVPIRLEPLPLYANMPHLTIR